MNTPHTPGPWKTARNTYGGSSIRSFEIKAGSETISHVSAHLLSGEANSKLIASAPCLLAALQGLLDQIENGRPFTGKRSDMERESVTQAQAAIAKALA